MTESIHVRVDPAQKRLIRRLAEANHRSPGAEVRFAIEKHLKEVA